ncbi:MAG: septal ring lytic transglycosylase RlpA family protein [Chthoniobacterales bacterium]|nr:septal ring lytic transglycosylase RlpA family protein [Chthoniobacterales bacterium]
MVMKALLSLLVVAAATLPTFAAQPVATKPSRPSETTTVQTGIASWYGVGFIGGKTANGETYRSGDRTAAHKSLPFNTWVRVTEKRSGRSTVVRINNRGPFVKGRVIDLSQVAAKDIGLTSRGITPVIVEVLPSAPGAIEKKVVSLDRKTIFENPLFH